MSVLKSAVLVEENLIKRMAGCVYLAERFFIDTLTKKYPTQDIAFIVSLNDYAG
ncbi:MAG TPA: hypothetical protein VKB02_06580 [Pyrinomonadaceae bacterium]|nr:hypothetical protein [Pyrinomonadaceae bacterium]